MKDRIVLTYINFTIKPPQLGIWGANCSNKHLSEMRKDLPHIDIKRCKFKDLPLYLQEQLENRNN